MDQHIYIPQKPLHEFVSCTSSKCMVCGNIKNNGVIRWPVDYHSAKMITLCLDCIFDTVLFMTAKREFKEAKKKEEISKSEKIDP
jgi:hypothetical protein